MANNGTMIYGQVRMTDIMAVLGISTTSTLKACNNSHGKIKKYARWKPTIWANQLLPRWDVWRGPDGRCGLTIKTYSSVGNSSYAGNFLYDIQHNLCEWVYNAPQGNASQPCRQGDFGQWSKSTGKAGNKGYDKNVRNPFTSFDLNLSQSGGTVEFPFEEMEQDDTQTATITAPWLRSDVDNLSTQLSLLDFEFNGVWAGEFYLGLVLSNGYVFTGDKKIKDGGMSTITAKNINLKEGETYTAYPFLSSYKRTWGENEQVGTLIPLDNWSFKVTINKQTSSKVNVYVNAMVSSTGQINGTLMINNDTSTSVTISNAQARFYRGKEMFVSGDLMQTVTVWTTGVSIQAGKSYMKSFTTSIPYPPPSNYPNYWVSGYVTSSGGSINYVELPLEDEDAEEV